MKIKILIIFFLILSGGVIYLAYPVIKNRYFQTTNDTGDEKNSSDIIQNTDYELEDSNNNTDADDENIIDDPSIDDDVFIEIDTEDCEDGCEQFEDADDKKYCQEYCGIQTAPIASDDCEKLVDLEKDYCWKNKALAEKNFSLCKKITDKKILDSCKTRLTEELLNSSEAINE